MKIDRKRVRGDSGARFHLTNLVLYQASRDSFSAFSVPFEQRSKNLGSGNFIVKKKVAWGKDW